MTDFMANHEKWKRRALLFNVASFSVSDLPWLLLCSPHIRLIWCTNSNFNNQSQTFNCYCVISDMYVCTCQICTDRKLCGQHFEMTKPKSDQVQMTSYPRFSIFFFFLFGFDGKIQKIIFFCPHTWKLGINSFFLNFFVYFLLWTRSHYSTSVSTQLVAESSQNDWYPEEVILVTQHLPMTNYCALDGILSFTDFIHYVCILEQLIQQLHWHLFSLTERFFTVFYANTNAFRYRLKVYVRK